MRVIGNEVWFDSTLVARLEPGINETMRRAVVEILQDTPDSEMSYTTCLERIAELERQLASERA